MFGSFISTTQLDTQAPCYRRTVDALDKHYSFMSSSAEADITGFSDFESLHDLTREFYRETHPDVYASYVPLYHSLWKLRLRNVAKIDNMHQDGGVHYFSRNGYQSRMMTIWTNIYKEQVPGLKESDMGIFVIDNKSSANQHLYERMSNENTHFYLGKANELRDCMYVCGTSIRYDLSTLERTCLDFREGVSIAFNSHLLHGSVPFSNDLTGYSEQDLNKFRVSLTSVWLHKDDVDWTVAKMPADEYESLYLSKVEKSVWPDVREAFAEACANEQARLTSISNLIKQHLALPSRI